MSNAKTVKLNATRTNSQPGTTDTDWLESWHSACPLHQHWYGRHIDAAQSPATPWSGRRSGSVDSISLARSLSTPRHRGSRKSKRACYGTSKPHGFGHDVMTGRRCPAKFRPILPTTHILELGTWNLKLCLQRYEKDWLETWTYFYNFEDIQAVLPSKVSNHFILYSFGRCYSL